MPNLSDPVWPAGPVPIGVPKRRKRHPVLWTLLSVVGAFLVLCVVLAIVDPAKTKQASPPTTTRASATVTMARVTTTGAKVVARKMVATTKPATSTTRARPATTTTRRPRTTVPAAQVLLDMQGSGDSSTSQFTIGTAAKEWVIGWAYNCSGFGSEGNFDYQVMEGSQQDDSDIGPNQLGMQGSANEYYYDTGTFNLAVLSECNWAIKVTAINS